MNTQRLPDEVCPECKKAYPYGDPGAIIKPLLPCFDCRQKGWAFFRAFLQHPKKDCEKLLTDD